jgi:hypothetical protein
MIVDKKSGTGETVLTSRPEGGAWVELPAPTVVRKSCLCELASIDVDFAYAVDVGGLVVRHRWLDSPPPLWVVFGPKSAVGVTDANGRCPSEAARLHFFAQSLSAWFTSGNDDGRDWQVLERSRIKLPIGSASVVQSSATQSSILTGTCPNPIALNL